MFLCIYLLQRDCAAIDLENSAFEKDDAIHLFWSVREKLFDTLFVSFCLEHHVRLKALHFDIHVRSRQKHFDIVDGDGVIGSYINDDARVQFLLQNDLPSPQRWLEHEAWFCNFDLLSVEVGRNSYCVARLCIFDCLCESLIGIWQFACRRVLVHDYAIRAVPCA